MNSSTIPKLPAPARNLALSSMLLAVAYVLPFFTGNIPQIGSMLLPMHLPVLLCGFLCGGSWGAAVGFAAPLLRSVITGGFPPMFPTAVSMAFELAAYGFLSGFLYMRLPKNLGGVYAALISAMAGGRVVWGLVRAMLTLAGNSSFSFALFIADGFLNAIPGILLQLVAIPAIVMSLQRARLFPREADR